MASEFSKAVELEGKSYQFQLLDLAEALDVESRVASLVAQTMGKGEKDHSLLFTIGSKVCKGLTVDDFEVVIETEFKGKALLFNKVMIAGVKANFPDFFTALAASEDSAIGAALAASGLGLAA